MIIDENGRHEVSRGELVALRGLLRLGRGLFNLFGIVFVLVGWGSLLGGLLLAVIGFGRNPFRLVLGCLGLIQGALLLFLHWRFRKEVGGCATLPDRITVKPVSRDDLRDVLDGRYFDDMAARLQELGYEATGFFIVPELPAYSCLQGFASSSDTCYAAILQAFEKDADGRPGRTSALGVELMTIYPSGASLTTTNLSKATGISQPPQSHLHIMPQADPGAMHEAHLRLRDDVVAEEPLPARPRGFAAVVVEDYLKAYAHLRLGKTLRRRDFPRLAARLMMEDHEGLARDLGFAERR